MRAIKQRALGLTLAAVLFCSMVFSLSGTVIAAGDRLAYVNIDLVDTGEVRVRGVDEDSTNDTLLSSGADYNEGQFGLRWSPDGTKIAYAVANQAGTAVNLYVMDADGTNHTALTTNNLSGVYGITWSPDSTKLAYVRSDDGTAFNIHSINVDGTGNTQLTESDTEACPQWSPANDKIVFTSLRDGNFELYTMNIDGSGETNITNEGANDGGFSFSGILCSFDINSAGDKIAFTTDRDDPGNGYEVYSMNIDGSGAERLTNSASTTTNTTPVWSNDDTMIAYGSNAHDPGGDDTTYQVYTMTAAGADETQLTSTGANIFFFLSGAMLFGGLDWSPDDDKLAFGTTRDGGINAYTMNADGTNQTLLAGDGSFYALWQPTGGGNNGGGGDSGGGSSGDNSSSGTLANTGANAKHFTMLAIALITTGVTAIGVFFKRQFATASNEPR